MKLLEKLGITPGPWECRDGWWIGKDKKCIATCADNISSLITAAPEMLEALIDQCMQLIDIGYLPNTENENHPVRIIEKATGKTWNEIKEIL